MLSVFRLDERFPMPLSRFFIVEQLLFAMVYHFLDFLDFFSAIAQAVLHMFASGTEVFQRDDYLSIRSKNKLIKKYDGCELMTFFLFIMDDMFSRIYFHKT